MDDIRFRFMGLLVHHNVLLSAEQNSLYFIQSTTVCLHYETVPENTKSATSRLEAQAT
jgi:hypothetical protein